MGFFQDLKEDLSQAVSEFGDKQDKNVKEKDLFAAAEESMGIEHDVTDDETPVIEEALGSFLDQVAANAESAEERYESNVPTEREEEEYTYEPESDYTYKPDPEYTYKPDPAYTYNPAAAVIEAPAYENVTKEEDELQISDEVAIITANMVVKGDMLSTGSMDVMGTVTGNVQVYGELNVTGEINGNASASNIIATGCTINGDLTSSGAIKIGNKAVIKGNVYATSAVISGAIKGDIDVHGPVILDSTAIVMGNIKSKAVQINNGAAIEGMCSQCYAEVSPSAFFND
ncbi:MAG: polymer-forming cytoskeletal protein [Lachnospiraceae bacterium]|nr:polymer-forming cytoskeletal protein [Lachnospiraceae bacterium]